MNKSQDSTSADHITAEACSWIAQLETGEMSNADVAAFREWIQRGPAHSVEVNRLSRLSARLNILSELAEPMQAVRARYAPIINRFQPQGMRSAWLGFGAFAVAVMAILAVVLLPVERSQAPLEFTTPVGGYLEKTLADGSTIRLNTNTRITVRYDRAQRLISLHQGEVFFEVVRDLKRPFVVATERGVVRALGTAFAVRLKDRGISVTVTRGRVAIDNGVQPQQATTAGQTTPATPTHEPIVLEAGQNYDESTSDIVKRVPDSDIQRQLAWQGGMFEFSDTRLEEVVAEVGRYTSQRIIIEDPELRGLKFDGIFRTRDTAPLFEALRDYFDVNVTYLDKDTVMLTRNKEPEFD